MNKLTIKYANHVDGTDGLLADIAWVPDGKPKPILAVMHGFGGDRHAVKRDLEELALQGVVAIAPDMRGRGKSPGIWDVGGMDVYDIVAAMDYVKMFHVPELNHEINRDSCHVVGYSGGGGNAIAAACRFPDYFLTATSFFGIADYGAWFRSNGRPDCSAITERIIGHPDTFPARFAARNMIPAAGNAIRTKVKFFWDITETQCPGTPSEEWIAQSRAAGGTAEAFISKPGDAKRWFHGYRTDNPDLSFADAIFMPDVLATPRPGQLDLPVQGELYVPGYLKTKHFSVRLACDEIVEGVARVRYDLSQEPVKVEIIERSAHTGRKDRIVSWIASTH